MIEIIIQEDALTDLNNIRMFYENFSEQTSQNVITDIYNAIDVLTLFPESGAKKSLGRRHAHSIKYRYTISYLFNKNKVRVIGVYKHQNR